MKVKDPRDCPFRHEDDEGEGTCWLDRSDCPQRRAVKREEPYAPPTLDRPIDHIQRMLAAPAVSGPYLIERIYSDQDKTKIKEYACHRRRFAWEHNWIDTPPDSCRLRHETLNWTGPTPSTSTVRSSPT